jgi:hypothetical protein
MKLLVVNFLLMLGLLGTPLPKSQVPVQADIVFRNAVVENLYPKDVIFRVEICGLPSNSQIIFNYTADRSGIWKKETRTLEDGQTPDACYKEKYFLETRNLYIPPFSEIKYFWSVTEGTKALRQSSISAYMYKNEGYTWKKLENEHLVIWWHDRPDEFGQDAMLVATQAFDDQAKFYVSSLEEPITIVVTNTSEEFLAWQPKENSLSGLAFPKLSHTVELIKENVDYRDALNDIIPHEISHIYFVHLLRKDAEAPRWLDEGLASYNEYSSRWGMWMTLRTAYDTGKTLPLKNLRYDLDEDQESFAIDYAEGYYAILYMEEVYGREAIAALLDEYRQGKDTADAFQKAFGKDPESFDSEFTAWLGKRVETPPPDTSRAPFAARNIGVLLFCLVGVLCLGFMFTMGAGAILVTVFLLNKRANRRNELKAAL